MWAVFGIGAIVCAALNILWSIQKKNARRFGLASLSLTALTCCAFYGDAAKRVIHEDWSGLMDILPTTSTALWICTTASILINFVAYFSAKHR